MANAATTNALERLLRPLSRAMTRDLALAIVNVQADDETQERYDELAEKCGGGQLTAGEQDELEGIVRANTLLGVLKSEARTFLAGAKPS